jgi:hypothetical protein
MMNVPLPTSIVWEIQVEDLLLDVVLCHETFTNAPHTSSIFDNVCSFKGFTDGVTSMRVEYLM